MSASNNGQQPEPYPKLWERLRAHADSDARIELIQAHMSFARAQAAGLFARRTDNNLEFEDYLHYAVVGLIEAIDRFQPAQSASFTTFAMYRVRGAILNGVDKGSERRELGAHLRRTRQERIRSLQARSDKHAGSLEPSLSATAGQGAASALFTNLVGLTTGLALGYMLEDAGLSNDAQQASSDDPYRVDALRKLATQLKAGLEVLPEREKLVVQYHYFYRFDFVALAGILEISKGRVSQLHKRALERLRQYLQQRGQFDDYF